MALLMNKQSIYYEIHRDFKKQLREFTYVTVDSDAGGEIALTFAYDIDQKQELWDVWVGDINQISFHNQQEAHTYYQVIRFLWENIGQEMRCGIKPGQRHILAGVGILRQIMSISIQSVICFLLV